MPRPVHSCLLFESSFAAAPASALAVELNTSTVALLRAYASLPSLGSEMDVGGSRGWNQLLLKSKKHRSDQLHEVKKRMRRRKLQ